MNERRMMLIDSKDALSSWGTWKTASELQDGDIIYGVAISFVSEIEYNNGSSNTRYHMRLYYNKNTTGNLYSTLVVGRCLISSYEPQLSVMIEPYGSTSKDYVVMNNFTFYANSYKRAICAAQAYWYSGNNSNFTDADDVLLPNGGAGMYIPFYFHTMIVYRNNSPECVGARFKYVAADANSTFPQNYDEVLFLTSDIISQ